MAPTEGDSGRKSGLKKTMCAIPDSLTATFVSPLEKQRTWVWTGRCSELFETQLGKHKYLTLVCHSFARNTDVMPLPIVCMVF